MKNIQVRYITRSGNTKKLADAIANAAGVQAASIPSDGSKEEADLLFLGASIYANGIDAKMKTYLSQLDPHKVKEVAVFSTSALKERAFPDIKKILESKGIKVREDNFYCRGQFTLLHRGRPNAADIADVTKFAKKVLG